MEESGRENVNGNVRVRITTKVYLFYGTMGQKWDSSRTLAGLQGGEKLKNGKVKMKSKNEKRKSKMWECKGAPGFDPSNAKSDPPFKIERVGHPRGFLGAARKG
jgi:hypothetical protein